MSRRLEEILIITSETDYLPFFRRFLGDSGRDIAAVKNALGSVYSPQNPNNVPEDNSIGSSWFDCDTNQEVSTEKLKTFDKKLKINLMSYQIANQFSIISYYFEKYCVKHIVDEASLLQQIEAAASLFDMEFGTIGEGTLSCLHEWRPGSVPYNKSFVVDTPVIIDEIPKFFYDLIQRQEIETPLGSKVVKFATSSDQDYSEFEQSFKNNNHSVKHFTDRIKESAEGSSSDPVYVKYTTHSLGSTINDSMLYSAAISVMGTNVEKDIQELKATELHRRLSPMLEPDHLTDPDPFDVGGETIGFFDRTKFTLENLPDFTDLSEEDRREMQDEALLKVLKHFQKPIVWTMSRDVIPTDIVAFANETSAEKYRQIIEQRKEYRITTRSAISEFSLTEQDYEAVYQEDLVSFDGNFPIRFIEFRTPSLRPGDVYRAYFEISKTFMNFVTNGKFELDFETERNYSNQTLSDQITETQSEMQNIYCAVNAPNEEDSKVKFQKYKAFAMKRKLEISREIRSKAIQASVSTPEGINVDLGVFGNIPFANMLDDTSLTSAEIIEGGLSELGSLLSAAIPPVGSNPDNIMITMKQLEEGATLLEKLFGSDKVIKDLETFKIKNENEQLVASLEANFIAQLPGWIRGLTSSDRELREKIRSVDGISSVEDLLNFEPPGLLQQGQTGQFGAQFNSDFISGGTVFNIKFANPSQIISIQIENPKLPGKVHDIYREGDPSYRPLRTPADRTRTINYLRNIFNMLPLGFAGGAAMLNQLVGMLNDPCSGPGEQPSKGAALILKYTIDNQGNPLKFEKDLSSYNPFHGWKENLIEREELKRTAAAYRNIKENFIDDVQWGADTTLSEIGPRCTLDDLYKEVFNKKNLTKLMCNYLTCIKLPDVNIQFPNLTLPELPEKPIFAWPFLDSSETLMEIINAMALRMLCAFVSNIFDILNTPFCEEQLRSDLYGAGSDVSPSIQAAFASAMLDTGIPSDKSGNANSLIEDAVNLLTPREVCALISGKPAGSQVYALISNISKNYDLEDELSTKEKIMNMFTTIGTLVPDEICTALNSDNIVGTINCSDVADQLVQIRNAASRGSVDPQKVQQAVDLAEKNLLDKSKAFEILTGEKGISDLFPGIDLSENLISPAIQNASKPVVDGTLDLVKRTFLTSMSNFVPSLYLEKSNIATIDDPEYDDIATMKFLRAINNISVISSFNITGTDFENQGLITYLRTTLLKLSDDFETKSYTNRNGDEITVYKSQLEPNTISEVTPLGDIEEEELPPLEDGQFSEKNTALKYSIVYGPDGSDTLLQTEDIDWIESQQRIQNTEKYSSVLDYLLPVNIEFSTPDESNTEIITSWRQWVGTRYRGTAPDHRDNVTIAISYLTAINKLVQRLQRDVQENIEAVFKSVDNRSLLEGIREFYDIEAEAIREEISRWRQFILTSKNGNTQTVRLKHPIDLTEVTMTDTTVNENYIKNRTTIDDEFFLGNSEFPVETITLCEEIPEKYQGFFRNSQTSNPLRRVVFREQLRRTAEKYYLDYFLEGSSTPFDDVNYLSYLDDAENSGYLEVLEGVIEQLVSYMGESRLFNDTGYVQRLDSKLRSRTFFAEDQDNSRACIINPLNMIDEGPIKFSELVSGAFQEEYLNELLSPENNPLNLDYSLPGPFEKAMMTTVFLGFIRIVCFEALLKGSISYSTWDIDFVRTDPMFKEYMYRLVENSIEKQRTFVDNKILVDDVLFKLAGTNNRKFAIKKIVDEQLANDLSKYSKILFENPVEKDYFLWFLEKMIFVDAPRYRKPEDNMWVSELTEQDIKKYRKNSFTYLERYIRTNGRLPQTISAPAELAQQQREALEEFIRFNSNSPQYEQSFINKMYDQNDPEFLSVPLLLDVPTAAEVESFDIGNATNIDTDTSEIDFDNDQWPDKELWSLEDFNQLLQTIFKSNAGVQKYIFHLLKKNYEPGTLWHDKPKTLKKRLPVKAIKRSRNYYQFSKKNTFTPKLRSDLERTIEVNKGGVRTERKQGCFSYHEYLVGNSGAIVAREFNESLEIERTFDDRYYISSINGEDVFDEQGNTSGIGLEASRFRSGVRTNVNPYNNSSEISDEDVLEVVDQDWIPDGLTSGEYVYINPAGQVSETQWREFVDATNDIIEEEYWEETIIDLVGNAAPIFNQPGISNYNPEDQLSSPQKKTIASALADAAMYTRNKQVVSNISADETGDGSRELRAILDVQNDIGTNEKGLVFHASGFENMINTNSHAGNSEDRQAFPARGMGLHDIEFKLGRSDNLNTNLQVRGDLASPAYAYFTNDLEPEYDFDIGGYRVKETESTELLGEDDYKIPLRMVITQVKNKNGTVKQCFVKYLIPKVVTFGITDQNTLTDRAAKLTQACVDSCDSYLNLINDTYKKSITAVDPRSVAVRGTGFFLEASNFRAVSNNAPRYTDSGYQVFDATKNRWVCSNYLFGIDFNEDNKPGHGGSVPVLLRQKSVELPGNSSYGVQTCSISKIWSQVAHAEANEKSGHFKEDVEPNQFENFDELFFNGIGNLLRIPDVSSEGEPLNRNQVGQQANIPFNADLGILHSGFNIMDIDRPSSNILSQFSNRTSMYHRAGRHMFYANSFKEQWDGDFRDAAYLSVANLVNWFSQRREDAFFGATSIDTGNHFTVFPDNSSFRASFLKSSGDRVGSQVTNQEAPDFACGPSLFYNDGRTTTEAFQNSLLELDRGTSAEADDLLAAFKRQNNNKLFGDQNLDIEHDHVTFYVNIKDTFKHYPPTLMETVSDARNAMLSITNFGANRSTVYVSGTPVAPQFEQLEVIIGQNLMINAYEALDINFHRANGLRSPYFGSEADEVSHLEKITEYIRTNSLHANYFNLLQSEAERYPDLVDRLSDDYNAALVWAQNLIDRLLNIQAGISAGEVGFLQALDVKHGIRMNLVAQDPNTEGKIGNFINKLWSEDSEVSEEERVGKICYQAETEQEYKEHVTVPIAFYERPLVSSDPCESSLSAGILRIPDTVRSRDMMMLENLAKDEEFKTFFEFCFPYRRLASLLTVHGTTVLAGYSEMPRVLTSTKSSLAAVFYMMSKQRSFSGDQQIDFGPGFGSTEILAMMGTGFPAGGEPPDCFEFPGFQDWFDMIAEMIKQFVKYFPSVIFRGIADQLDPAYKEMKSHYYACEIQDLRFNSVHYTAGDGKTQYGLRGDQKGEKKYIPINIGFPYDSIKGLGRILKGDGAGYLGKTMDRLVGYILGGPAQLVDASYAFQIPCKEKNITGDFRGWSKYKVGSYGRYGHPLTLFTMLALPTYELPRDIEYKNLTCTASELRDRGVQIVPCSEDEE